MAAAHALRARPGNQEAWVGGGGFTGVDVEGGAGRGPPQASARGRSFTSVASKESLQKLMRPMGIILGLTALIMIFTGQRRYAVAILGICACGLVFTRYISNWVMSKDEGSPAMRKISDPIRQGAEGFLRVQYTAILRLALVVGIFIFISYKMRPSTGEPGLDSLGSTLLGLIGCASFAIGAACSAAAGYISMWVSAHANIRVASAARRSYQEALAICFRGGAFSAVLVLALCVSGVTILNSTLYYLFGVTEEQLASGDTWGVTEADVPLLTVGYGFGASFVALFMQLGGGVYTKAADVGADLVGKVEQGIPEDDPRNPAVIADLVGDMVGDCVGSSADIFESIAAEIIGAMILGGTLAKEANLESAAAFSFFPVMIHAFDIIVSSIGIMYLGDGTGSSRQSFSSTAEDPTADLMRGYRLTLSMAAGLFLVATRWLLYTAVAPWAWLHYYGCGLVGMGCSLVFVASTKYFTDYNDPPVQSIAEASKTGHATNIIIGFAVGMQSTAIPVLTVSAAVVSAYWLGRTTGLGDGNTAGLFGLAVATMGMLSSAGFVLAMNNYGPIADNAGGIVEMSEQEEHVRDTTDRLDASGNVTKAVAKGYSIGSAALACFVLFGALLDEFSIFAGRKFETVDLAKPEVMVGGLLGVGMIFYFVGLSVSAVGRTAEQVVNEVRRQFAERPGIMDHREQPDYKACVSIVTTAALREMQLPGLLAVALPVVVGLVFRYVGEATDRPLLGPEVLAAYLMFATAAGILMALFLDNVGGAWDNAKKYIESGQYGGKGSEAHKASVTGDTVGDPFKDTAGPALHVVIKLLSTTILVLGPLFVAHQGALEDGASEVATGAAAAAAAEMQQ